MRIHERSDQDRQGHVLQWWLRAGAPTRKPQRGDMKWYSVLLAIRCARQGKINIATAMSNILLESQYKQGMTLMINFHRLRWGFPRSKRVILCLSLQPVAIFITSACRRMSQSMPKDVTPELFPASN